MITLEELAARAGYGRGAPSSEKRSKIIPTYKFGEAPKIDQYGLDWAFNSHGFCVTIHPLIAPLHFQEKIIPTGTIVGEMDLSYYGNRYRKEKVFSNLFALYAGIQTLLDYSRMPCSVTRSCMPIPAYFYGATNLRMANYLQRQLGFQVEPHQNHPDTARNTLVDLETLKTKLKEDRMAGIPWQTWAAKEQAHIH